VTPPSAARLVTLTAIVVALAAAVGIFGGERVVVERPLVAPGLAAADVTGIDIVRGDAPPIVIAIDPAGTRVEAPVPGPAEEATVRDLISAVVAARADRVLVGDAARRTAGLDATTLRVRLERRDGPPIELVRGTAVPASGQIWLGVDGRAVLVPAWVGAALDRDLAALRRLQVFPPVALSGVELHGRGVDLVLSGGPLRRRDEGTSLRVSRAAVARLDAALAAVVLDVLVTGDTSTTSLTVRVLGGAAPHELEVHGECPGHPTHVLVTGSAGVGCVARATVDDVVAAAAALAGPAGMEVTLAPGAGADIESIRAGAAAGDGATSLARRGAGWLLDLGDERVDADDDAVAQFFEALAQAGELVPPPSGAPATTWTVTLTGGAVETWRWYTRGGVGAPVVRRDDEPHALALDARAGAALRRFGPRLRNLTLLVVDASMVNAVRATGVHPATLVRGQLVGDWIVDAPLGATATPAAPAMVELLAGLRGTAWLDAGDLGAVRRTLTFSIDAPPIPGGQPSTHTIVVGAARPGDRCAARVDDFPPIELAAATCAALLAPLVAQ